MNNEGYSQFITRLNSDDIYMSKDVYYKSIIQFAPEIMLDIHKTNQTEVSERLNMTQTKLSNMLNILRYL